MEKIPEPSPVDGTEIETEPVASPPPGPRPPYWLFWYIGVYSIIVVPVVCFGMAFTAESGGIGGPPDWQSGEPRDYAWLLLRWSSFLGFLPLWIYATVCAVLLLFLERRMVRYTIVRFGVYTGIILSLNFLCIYLCAIFGPDVSAILDIFIFGLLCLWFSIPGLIAFIVIRFVAVLTIQTSRQNDEVSAKQENLNRSRLREFAAYFGVLIACWIIGFFIAVAQMGSSTLDPEGLLGGPLFGTCIIGPFFTLGSYLWLTLRIRRYQDRWFRFSLAWLFLLMGWFGLFLAAWQYAIREMFRLYNELPTTPPAHRCYIATAAARGRPRRVGSWLVRAADGTTFRVNRQLLYLKAGELALKAVLPRLHRLLRRIYDTVGPPIARRIRHPLAAEAAYWSLKPFEWAVRLTLPLLVPDWEVHAIRFYNRSRRIDSASDTNRGMPVDFPSSDGIEKSTGKENR